MKLALFSPYGLSHAEAGLLYLVGNYLLKQGADVVQLRCDGAFSTCGRDTKVSGGRNVMTCARCIGEQRSLASWISCKTKEISSYLVSDDVVQSAKWLSSVKSSDLSRAEFRGVKLWGACGEEFALRYPESAVSELSISEEVCLRQLYTTYVHAVVAAERFVTATSPTLHLVAGKQDPLARAYVSQAQASGGEVGSFFFDTAEGGVVVESHQTGGRYVTALVLQGVTSMRSDPRTWAPEVTATVHEIVTLLGCAPDRIT
jgi:hypothetical protein